MWFKKYWKAILGVAFWLGPIWDFVKWCLDWRGRVDALASTYQDVGGYHVVIGYLLDPPPFLYPPAMIIGVALIWWNFRKPKSTSACEQINSLNNFYSTSHQLLSRIALLPENVSDEYYNNLQNDIDQWSQALETYIDQHLGVAEKSRLMEMSPGTLPFNPEIGYREEIAIDRARTLFALTTIRKNLLSLIDRLNTH